MQVSVLYFAGCPNWRDAGQRLRQALDQIGRPEIAIGFDAVETEADAAAAGFAGSPTFTLDGIDLFGPAPVSGGLTCRVYATPGGLAGVPEVDDLVAALTERAVIEGVLGAAGEGVPGGYLPSTAPGRLPATTSSTARVSVGIASGQRSAATTATFPGTTGDHFRGAPPSRIMKSWPRRPLGNSHLAWDKVRAADEEHAPSVSQKRTARDTRPMPPQEYIL